MPNSSFLWTHFKSYSFIYLFIYLFIYSFIYLFMNSIMYFQSIQYTCILHLEFYLYLNNI